MVRQPFVIPSPSYSDSQSSATVTRRRGCAWEPREVMMSGMNLYHCVVCGYPIDPNAEGTWQQVNCWVKVGKTGGIKQTEKLYRYAHGICVESPPKGQTETLFG